jgi:glycine/D-amino acid oxidase-like deaminating enzyme
MILVVGGGVFGLTAALELRARGREVKLCDPGTLPHPLAESTDLSKVVRCDYGADLLYTELGERSLAGWRRWNERAPLYHETGVTFLASAPMQPGGFEYESFALLSARGHRIERLDAIEIPRRFPAYRPGALVDGYVHAEGGWARASSTITHLAARARAAGVEVVERCAVTELVDDGVMIAGEHVRADAVIVCAGSWTPRLVPDLASSLRAIGQPVFHFQPAEPGSFDASVFPVFGGDISRTGYYGFPLTDGVVKIANHGTGREITTGRETVDVTAAERDAVRAFVRDVFPALEDAPITHTRCCVYGDSLDGHFVIAPHPERPNLVVAAGGSGHAFKFAPVLGELIANAVDGQVIERFRWRTMSSTRGDAARA